jgi:hypothetical protein
MAGTDWDLYARKLVDSPLEIDFQHSNIHEEFLEIDVKPD